MSKLIKFEDALTPSDFGFVVCSNTGHLKGLWIPEGMENQQIPENIVRLCKDIFGIDPSSDNDETTIH